jgi:hypothetical protein
MSHRNAGAAMILAGDVMTHRLGSSAPPPVPSRHVTRPSFPPAG